MRGRRTVWLFIAAGIFAVSLGVSVRSATMSPASPIPYAAAVASPSGHNPIVMKLRRSCWTCPNYSITLTGDGELTYVGTAHTHAPGMLTTSVDAATVNDLMRDFLQSEFPDMENIYPAPGTDRMIVTLSIEMDGFSKSVMSEERYGPQMRLVLERKMDDLPGMRALSGWAH